MSDYLLRFRVETCLKYERDLTVSLGGINQTFLFSEQRQDDAHVIAKIEIQAANYDEAWGRVASSLLPPVLDALSFATGTPLLLRDLELVLKAEAGNRKRRGLYVGHMRVPSRVQLSNIEIKETEKILAAGEQLRLPLCWHRYALDRELAHEQFVFNWLAFEALAGDTDVPSRCPKCHQELSHCGFPVVHRSSSKIAAREIFQAAHPGTTDQEFNNSLWNKA